MFSVKRTLSNIEGMSAEAIIRTCQAYSAGDVKGQSLDWPPAGPRFIRTCREMQAAMDYARRPQIPHTPEPEHSDEHRAMMLKRLGELSKSLGTHQEH